MSAGMLITGYLDCEGICAPAMPFSMGRTKLLQTSGVFLEESLTVLPASRATQLLVSRRSALASLMHRL